MKIKWIVAVLLLTLIAPSGAGAEELTCELTKMYASDAKDNQVFGSSVSILGDRAVVGARNDLWAGPGSGSAFILRHEGDHWVEEVKITASDPGELDYYGSSVAMGEGWAFVAAPRNDEAGSGAGAVYIYQQDGPAWTETDKLVAGVAGMGDQFGSGVSVSGDRLLVGAEWSSIASDNGGAAYVFRREGTDWVEEAELVPADTQEWARFGHSVSISGDYAVAGAHWDDSPDNNTGSAYVFHRYTLGWAEVAKLTASDGVANEEFGGAVAISGDYAMVGARLRDGSAHATGGVYVFQRQPDGTWVETGILTASDEGESHQFGNAIHIDGDLAVIGAMGDWHAGFYSGSAYVFQRTGGDWIEIAKLVDQEAENNDDFGTSVSIDGAWVLIGEPRDKEYGYDSGSATFFGIGYAGCGTVDAALDCDPVVGILPFTTSMTVTLTNRSPDWTREVAGRIDLALAGGGFYGNWKAGHTVLAAGETMDLTWNQVIPALQPVLGDNLFTLVAEDVTPAPYNQPPYPPSGYTATDGAVVTGFVP